MKDEVGFAGSVRFAIRIVTLCRTLDEQSTATRTLAEQLLRVGTSIDALVEEAIAAHRKPDFISKQRIALKEARETHYWLRLPFRDRTPSRIAIDRPD